MFRVDEEEVKPMKIGKYGYEAILSRSIYNGCVPAHDIGIYIGIYLFNGKNEKGEEYYNQSLHLNFGENLGISLRENPFNSNDSSQEKHFVITEENLLYGCFAALLERSNPFVLVDNTNTGLAKEVVIVGHGNTIELSFINKRVEFTSLNKFAVVNENYKQKSTTQNAAVKDFFTSCFERLKIVQIEKEAEEKAKEEQVKIAKLSLIKVPQ